MQLQLLSDLHLETESFDPVPAPQAELLVLAGDVDSTWAGYERFAGWPVPVIVVAGNHEFDGRDFDAASQGLRDLCERQGRALRAAEYFLRLMATTRHGRPFDAAAVREHEGLACRAWLEAELRSRRVAAGTHRGGHALRAQPAQRRPALRPPARHRQLLQCRRRPDPARRPVAARPPALPARLQRAPPRSRAVTAPSAR
jgi:hypothetical protein